MTTPDYDDERTVIKGALAGPHGALRAGLPGEYADALPAGTSLHEFEFLSVVGQGGFGIVYLAHELKLDRRVAIKEYMPSALARRTQAMTVAVRSSRHPLYALWMRQFARQKAQAKVCINIVGHTSRNDGEAYNDKLSPQRSAAIRQKLGAEAGELMPRTATSGVG